MAIWRSPEMEALVGGPLDDSGITEESIARLVAEATRESDLLDFKQSLWQPTRGSRPPCTGEQEFAKDIAALANQRGGLLIVGVRDASGTATAVTRIPAAVMPEREERRLRQALLNYQAPLAACEFVGTVGLSDHWRS